MMPNMLMPPATSSTSTPEPGWVNPDDLWNKYYAGIRIANEFIENVDRVNLDKYRLDPDNQNEYQNRLNDLKTWKYEARF